MLDDKIIESTSEKHVAQSIIETPTEEEQREFKSLPSLEIEVEQAEYIQTIGQGWAYPLQKFMDELQLLEVMHMKTLTDASGKRHLFSVPITQSVTKEQYEALKGQTKIALKCSTLSEDVLAVIENPVFFENRKEEICARTFGTFSLKHPKIERIMQ